MTEQELKGERKSIPLSQLEVDPMNVRIDVGDVSELMESIKSVGLLHPLVVRPKNGRYSIICGSRRYHALLALGAEQAECFVLEAVGDLEALRLSWDENEKAMKLSESERKAVYKRALQMTGSLRKAAQVLGVSHETIRIALDDENIEQFDDIMVVRDKRKHKLDTQAVGKTVKAKAQRLLKKIIKEKQEKDEPVDPEPALKQQFTKLVEKLNWQPRVWTPLKWERYKNKPIHEILSSTEGIAAVPDVRTARMSMEWQQAGSGPAKAVYPVVRLDPPLDRIRVIACPNCGAPLRGYARGAGVVCDECGFPNQDMLASGGEENGSTQAQTIN